MTKKEFYESLSSELKEKIRNCKDEQEMLKVLEEADIELAPELLENVSGGSVVVPKPCNAHCPVDCFCD